MSKRYNHSTEMLIDYVTVSNKYNGDMFTGNILDEKEIDGKHFWVFNSKERPGRPLLLSKEYFTVKKSKN